MTHIVLIYEIILSNIHVKAYSLQLNFCDRHYDCALGPGDTYTVKPLCNGHLCDKIYYLWFIQ